MKPAAPRNLKKFLFLGVILILFISIGSWTALSPQVLLVQSNSQIANSLFQFAKVKQLVNFTDGEGSYAFLFGMDYNDSASQGVPTIVQVFASLLSQRITSGFQRGIGLQVTRSTVLIDGIEDSGISSRTTTSGEIADTTFSSRVKPDRRNAYALSSYDSFNRRRKLHRLSSRNRTSSKPEWHDFDFLVRDIADEPD